MKISPAWSCKISHNHWCHCKFETSRAQKQTRWNPSFPLLRWESGLTHCWPSHQVFSQTLAHIAGISFLSGSGPKQEPTLPALSMHSNRNCSSLSRNRGAALGKSLSLRSPKAPYKKNSPPVHNQGYMGRYSGYFEPVTAACHLKGGLLVRRWVPKGQRHLCQRLRVSRCLASG